MEAATYRRARTLKLEGAYQASTLFTEDEKGEFIDFLAANPLAGDVITGTGGVRKPRLPASGSGKCGGVRVVYYYLDADILLSPTRSPRART